MSVGLARELVRRAVDHAHTARPTPDADRWAAVLARAIRVSHQRVESAIREGRGGVRESGPPPRRPVAPRPAAGLTWPSGALAGGGGPGAEPGNDRGGYACGEFRGADQGRDRRGRDRRVGDPPGRGRGGWGRG